MNPDVAAVEKRNASGGGSMEEGFQVEVAGEVRGPLMHALTG